MQGVCLVLGVFDSRVKDKVENFTNHSIRLDNRIGIFGTNYRNRKEQDPTPE
jgi:hypothetical protein